MTAIASDGDSKRVFSFADAYHLIFGTTNKLDSDLRAAMRNLFGGKGAALAEMTAAGVNVPAGLIVSTSVCRAYHSDGQNLPQSLIDEITSALVSIERKTGRSFGDANNPLLIAVRSGARVSMPGMMDTILNLGLNDSTVKGLAGALGELFALDSYRRFIQMYGSVVLGIESGAFESRLERIKSHLGVESDSDLGVEPLRALVRDYKQCVLERTGAPFPQDVLTQLIGAVEAVLKSWNNRRAVFYRKMNGIDNDLGTAVVLQAMVFGNLNLRSGTGVCFSRDPNTGERKVFGEYMARAQGEDLVAGVRTPQPLDQLAAEMPEVFDELVRTARRLEETYLDVQEIEYTVENGKLFILQTRKAKCTTNASVRIAVALVEEGLISKDAALTSVKSDQLEQLLIPCFSRREVFEAKAAGKLLGSGLPAAPGAAVGKIVFSADEAEALGAAGEQVILVRVDTDPDDINGIKGAIAIVTARGGMTSHAAVVAREMGKPCVTGCGALHIDQAQDLLEVNGVILRKNDVISVSGTTGEVFAGALQSITVELEPHVETFLSWRTQM